MFLALFKFTHLPNSALSLDLAVCGSVPGARGIALILLQWHKGRALDIGRSTALPEQVKCTCRGLVVTDFQSPVWALDLY